MDKTEQLIKGFGDRIRHLRESRNISQEAFAEAAGMDRAGYGRIERGQVDVRLSTIARIAEALELPMADLLEQPERSRRKKAPRR
jgi:transcriptional regulator with XRE-family HTH domain